MSEEKQHYILDVHFLSKEGPGDYICQCPHCGSVRGLEGERASEIRGEQYKCNQCDEWMQVDSDAKLVETLPIVTLGQLQVQLNEALGEVEHQRDRIAELERDQQIRLEKHRKTWRQVDQLRMLLAEAAETIMNIDGLEDPEEREAIDAQLAEIADVLEATEEGLGEP